MAPVLTQAKELISECILRRHTGQPFVMVEGKTDRALWLEYAACDPIPTQGKEPILKALDSFILREAPGIAGIIDADYWLLSEADALATPNLLFDDCCPDMEMILLGSPALKKVLRHELHTLKSADAHAFAESLTQNSQRLAAEIGYFRWLNETERYGLNFKVLCLPEFVDSETLTLDREWLARRLAGGKDVSSETLLMAVAALRETQPPGAIQLCRGKDMLAIMAYIAPRVYQQHFDDALPESARELFDEARLAKELRKAYEYIYFVDTSLYQRIRDWQCANHPYRIIRDFPVPG